MPWGIRTHASFLLDETRSAEYFGLLNLYTFYLIEYVFIDHVLDQHESCFLPVLKSLKWIIYNYSKKKSKPTYFVWKISFKQS